MALWIFLVFLVGLAFAVPITMSMVLGAMTPLVLGGTGSSIQQLIANSFSGSDTTPILAVPLFILGGVLMAEGGISRRLFNFFAYFVGNLPGGLPCAVILTCLFYGAISGSGPATTAAVGSMTIPFLVEMGYDKTWSAGMVATAGGLGVIIPPSIPFVLYSLATGVSTGALFLGGILPGILIGLGMMVYAVFYCIKKGEDKEKINTKMKELRGNGFLKLLKESFWALLSPVIVLGGIYSGLVTPTEAACISVFYSLFVSLVIYKSFTVKEVIPFLAKAVKTYAPLCFVLAFAVAFGRVLALAKAPALIEGFILTNFTSSFTVLTGIVVIFLILGMVMDTGPAIVILSPILLPAVQALGVDPVHFGVIMVCCLSIGLATPPFGLDLFVAGTLSDTPPMNVAKKAIPFILAFGVALFAITYVPWLSLAFL
ncbi:TRAP transporter large permease [Gudongella oleilytica]|jgi:C4-dicarboxylate transporter DctM subunit|uniref:TRAP transporter large permease n=1 Tax=Gudongella oleilytica TaxID=1582259 RepID=UPI002A35A0EE|nr:TRAP transporter large permease [Gudongella oleilytica]MDY0257203.1 TRAP transporter large permease [Gudongella oleilytica]